MPSARGQLGGHGLGPLVGVGEEAFVVEVDGDAGDGGGGHGQSSLVVARGVLAGGGHGRAEAGQVAAGQQAVPVDGLEQQLAEVVEP